MHSEFAPERGYGAVARAFFERARAAAALCSVTRLADITGLDRIGLPVWQTVRPAGRSLSVHQGKGPSPQAAQIGALCEAIEADCAEKAPAEGPLSTFADLPPSLRAPEMGDYCRARTNMPGGGEPLQWCSATDILTGNPLYLPHHLVSLDYTMGLPSLLERSSAGLGAGPTEADALAIALFEIIERDAVGEWKRLDSARRAATSQQLDSIPFDWLQSWRARLASLDIDLEVFRIESIVGIPVFMCMIGGIEEFGCAYRSFYGTSAHADPEVALFKAFAEAVQSRLTLIAGVRDDILPSYYSTPRPKPTQASPGSQAWIETEPVPADAALMAQRLADLGYRQVATKRLDDRLDGIAVTKAFVPGLGSLTRSRRDCR